MTVEQRRFLMIALIIAAVLALVAPFIASSNPDGLESAAESFEEAEGKAVEGENALFPDYTIQVLGDSGLSGSLALIIGLALMLGITYGVGKLIVKR